MVTVDKAIKRGHQNIIIPAVLIVILTLGMMVFLASKKIVHYFFVPASFIIGPLLSWTFWRFAITRWRIWAFSNVEDTEELKRQAIERNLLYPDNSFFEQSEIRTKDEQALINDLEKRFEKKQKIKVTDDPTIPISTKIFYSKRKMIFESLIMISFLSGGIYLFMDNSRIESLIWGSFAILTGGYVAFRNIKRITDDQPEITLDNTGIEIKYKKYSWKEINSVNVTHKSYGTNKSHFILKTNGITIEQCIDDYNLKYYEIRHRLKVYRKRFDNATTANSMFALWPGD